MHASRTHRLAAVAGALLIAGSYPAVAWAVSQQYNGSAAGGVNNAGVEFGAHLSRAGKPTQVRRFAWFNVPVTCAPSGRTAVSDTLPRTMRVSATRRFSVTTTVNGGRTKVVVAGRFSKSFGQAHGTLRITGTVSGCGRGDSGVVSWTAPKVGRPK